MSHRSMVEGLEVNNIEDKENCNSYRQHNYHGESESGFWKLPIDAIFQEQMIEARQKHLELETNKDAPILSLFRQCSLKDKLTDSSQFTSNKEKTDSQNKVGKARTKDYQDKCTEKIPAKRMTELETHRAVANGEAWLRDLTSRRPLSTSQPCRQETREDSKETLKKPLKATDRGDQSRLEVGTLERVPTRTEVDCGKCLEHPRPTTTSTGAGTTPKPALERAISKDREILQRAERRLSTLYAHVQQSLEQSPNTALNPAECRLTTTPLSKEGKVEKGIIGSRRAPRHGAPTVDCLPHVQTSPTLIRSPPSMTRVSSIHSPTSDSFLNPPPGRKHPPPKDPLPRERRGQPHHLPEACSYSSRGSRLADCPHYHGSHCREAGCTPLPSERDDVYTYDPCSMPQSPPQRDCSCLCSNSKSAGTVRVGTFDRSLIDQAAVHTAEAASFDANVSLSYLLDERNRLVNKITYLKLTYKAYKLRLAEIDSTVKLLKSNTPMYATISSLQSPRAEKSPFLSRDLEGAFESASDDSMPEPRVSSRSHRAGHNGSRKSCISPAGLRPDSSGLTMLAHRRATSRLG